eukprot:COSAG02_NODE_13566_length_1378_cov_2.273651_2_plen_96_part_00
MYRTVEIIDGAAWVRAGLRSRGRSASPRRAMERQSAAPSGWRLHRGGWVLLAAVLSSPAGAGSPRQHVAPLASQTVYRAAVVPYGGAANDAIDLT